MKRIFLSLASAIALWAVVFGSLRGVVHDPDHRPVAGVKVVVKSSSSDFSRTLSTDTEGSFEATSIPVGAYQVTVTEEGFAPATQEIVVASGSAPVLHFQLQIGNVSQSVNVSEGALAVNPEQMTPTVMISRQEIQATPGADLSNSFNMITDFVPGAWMTHDQLHAPIQSRPDCLSLFMNPTERGSSLPE